MVKIRLRGKNWQYDILFRWPDGTRFRERANAPVASKSAAQRWALAREGALLTAGKDAHVKRADQAGNTPDLTFEDFWPDVLRDHYEANRKKASTIDAAKSIVRLHLAPPLGTKPLHLITSADVASLKGRLATSAPKTVNNVLSVLSRALGCAVEWGRMPGPMPRITLLPITKGAIEWYERDEFRRLVASAAKIGTHVHVLVLLGGSAGLRRGEIQALRWTDLDLIRKQINVQRSLWRKVEGTPKGGRSRLVPMTDELCAALKAHRHLMDRVISNPGGGAISNRTARNWMAQAQRCAGLVIGTRRETDADAGGVHILRHTFCSHLAAAGVPAKAIQELAGHADLSTTLRYMHLAPGDRDGAMATLTGYYRGSTQSTQQSHTEKQHLTVVGR